MGGSGRWRWRFVSQHVREESCCRWVARELSFMLTMYLRLSADFGEREGAMGCFALASRDIGRESFSQLHLPLFQFFPCLYLEDYISTMSLLYAFEPRATSDAHHSYTFERVYVRHPHIWDFAASTLLREHAHWRAQLRLIHFSHIPKSGEERRGSI